MKLEVKERKHNFMFNNEEVEVKEIIPTERKNAIIMTAITESLGSGTMPSRMIFEATLYTLICYEYCEVEFEDLGDAKILDAFDVLTESGFLPAILAEIDPEELKSLKQFADITYEDAVKYYNSGTATLEAIIKMASSIILQKQQEDSIGE